MLYIKEAHGTVDEVVQKLTAGAAARKLGVLATHDLKEKMNAKGVAFDRQCRVLEVCNPGQASKVLQANMSISTALPCRISVYEDAGAVKVATLLPTAVLGLFGSPELQPVARDIEQTILAIIDEACR